MQAVSSYVRDIAVFIIFAAIIEIILPDNKFKEYVHLITGLILIYIMAMPLVGLTSSFQIPSALAYQLDKSILRQEQSYYEEKQKEMILDEYKSGLYAQLETIISNYYTLLDANITVSANDESFGEIEKMSLIVTEKNVDVKKKLIRIEKVGTKDSEETEGIKKLKNSISDFYNLSVDNIHITVQTKDG